MTSGPGPGNLFTKIVSSSSHSSNSTLGEFGGDLGLTVPEFLQVEHPDTRVDPRGVARGVARGVTCLEDSQD